MQKSLIQFDAAAMEILRRELKALGMRIGYSDRAGYFVTDAVLALTFTFAREAVA
jgi:hypothetical protein